MPRRDVGAGRGETQVAKHLECGEEHRKRRAARGDLLETALLEPLRRRLDEPRDELVVVLRGDAPVLRADAQEGRGVASEPLGAGALVDRVEELIEEAPTTQTVAQALLVGGVQEEHLLHEQLRVVRVVPAAEAQQQVDLVDPGEVAGVRSPVFLAPDAIGLVVGTDAVEEAVDVELGEEDVVERPTSSSAARASSKSVSATGCEIPIGGMRMSVSAARMYAKIPRVL